MKNEIKSKILEMICSKSLQKAIHKSKFEISDYDLLLLVYRHASDYETRLNLITLIETNTTDAFTKEQAKKCVALEKEKLKRFSEPENDCVFEVKIKETPQSHEERYLAKTFNGALKKVKYFCEHYDFTKLNEDSHIEIVKRKVVDETKAEDFDEDWRGEAIYNGKLMLENVLHEDMENGLLDIGSNCNPEHSDTLYYEQKCKTCNNFCFTGKTPNLPRFLKNLDIVCYKDYFGTKQYAITYVFKDDDGSDDCAYCIPLDKKYICNQSIKSKKAFFKKIFNSHEHIEYPRIDVIKETDLPNDALKAYQALIRLNERFNDLDVYKK